MKITKSNVDYDKIYHFTKQDCDVTGLNLNGIRMVDVKHTNEIKNAIKSGKTFIACIEVDINTMGIADGQHRYQAYRSIWNEDETSAVKMDVRFLDIPSKMYDDIVKDKNIHSKNWTIKDYKEAMRRNPKNQSISMLDDFCQSHNLLHGKAKDKETNKYKMCKDRYAMAILKGENQTKQIKDGTFTLNNVEIKDGDALYVEIEHMVTKLGLTSSMGNWFEAFCSAWYKMRHDYRSRSQIERIGFNKVLEKIDAKNFSTSPSGSRIDWENRFTTLIDNISNNRI